MYGFRKRKTTIAQIFCEQRVAAWARQTRIGTSLTAAPPWHPLLPSSYTAIQCWALSPVDCVTLFKFEFFTCLYNRVRREIWIMMLYTYIYIYIYTCFSAIKQFQLSHDLNSFVHYMVYIMLHNTLTSGLPANYPIIQTENKVVKISASIKENNCRPWPGWTTVNGRDRGNVDVQLKINTWLIND